MKRVIIKKPAEETILLAKVNYYEPIFAKHYGKFAGMIVEENSGWILRTGKKTGATGHYKKLSDCIESCMAIGFSFFVY